MGMSKAEKDLRAAFKVKGTPLYHYKGFYTLIVYDYVETERGEYVQYFNADNCDLTYVDYDGAFVRQDTPGAILRERFWNENVIRCASVERLLVKKGTTFKLSLTPPTEVEVFQVKMISFDEEGNVTVTQGEDNT
jgi:hypothetical protein